MARKRLNHDDRINLQAGIAKGYSLRKISEMLGKSRSTIYREIVGNCCYKDCRHTCAHCALSCGDPAGHYENGLCREFVASECPRWGRFPYTCNGCAEAKSCFHRKRYYDCVEAHHASKRSRSEPRAFKGIGETALKLMDSIVSGGIRLGQSIHHIYVSNPPLRETCCERTVRRYLYRGYLSAMAHELPRYARFSHGFDYGRKRPVNVERMLGRTFSDYGKCVESHPDGSVWQYDSMEGKATDRKAILTITFPEFRFQFGYLISKQSMASVYGRIRALQRLLGKRYEEIFQINLSDNGPEFSRFHEIETDEFGHRLCKVFFTNPYRSTDKASCGRNHEFIRYVIPKGKSLDSLTQEKVALLFSHINSYARGSNKDKTPYDLMVGRFGAEFMKAIGIARIPPNEVCLRPSLLE